MKTFDSRVILIAIACFTAAADLGATPVAAGESHSCAVFNGGVQCWGKNLNGQLGNGSSTQSLIPVQAIAVGSNATAVVTGSVHSCAVVDGGVQCWGNNASGQLGNGSTVGSSVPVLAILPGNNATAIAVGQAHSCAVVNGAVKCWGNNQYGRLGDGTTTNRLVPVTAMASNAIPATNTVDLSGTGCRILSLAAMRFIVSACGN